MNFIKKLSLLAALVAVMFAFNACEEDTVAPVDDVPSAPIGLEATSINSTTVHIRWQDASTIDADQLQDYTVTYYPSNTSSDNAPEMTAMKSGEAFEITGLDSNKEHTFEVVTNYKNGESSTATMIKWAPAMRFVSVAANTIKLYTTDVVGKGSGLALYEDDGLGEFLPTVLVKAQMSMWNLGLHTTTAGEIVFGSASQLPYDNASTAIQSAEISSAIPAASLNDVFDSQGLDNRNYSQNFHNLTNATSSVVIYVKSTTNGEVHYAKVFLKYVNDSFIQSDGGDNYVEIQVSYQATAGLPYAKK